jgi:hypothetical protein
MSSPAKIHIEQEDLATSFAWVAADLGLLDEVSESAFDKFVSSVWRELAAGRRGRVNRVEPEWKRRGGNEFVR